ncbi:MAG: sulfatase-like hydrolase/transferase [Verrucomicrobiota bacterium]
MKPYLSSLFIFLLVGFTANASKSPNILWIITDDHRSDSLECFNQATRGTSESALGYVESPNINSLATEGVLFTNAYCNSPACAPSRSSMHTGKYPHRNGMYGFRKAHQAADCSSRMIPEVMKEHGYQPAAFGKPGYYIYDWEGYHQWQFPGHYNPMIHRNAIEKTSHSDFWWNRPWEVHDGKGMVIGKEEIFRYADGTEKSFWLSRKDRELTSEELAMREEVEEELDILRTYTRSNPELIIGGVSSNTTWNTLDGAIVKCMQNYLAHENKEYRTITGDVAQGPNTNEPVFIHLGFALPHTPVLPSKEFRDRFAGKTYDVPDYDAKEADLLPPTLQDLRNDMDFSRMTDEEKQQAIRDYYAFCAMGDYLLGEAVKSFKEYCARNDQEYLILFVCGDHGWHLGEQGIEAKFGPWYQSQHGSVIAVSSNPEQFPAGKVVNDMVEYVDFAPTFYEVADIDPQVHPGLNGFSLTKTMNEGAQREYIIGEMIQVRGPRAYLRSDDFSFSMRTRPYWGKPGEGYAPGEKIKWGLEAPLEKVELSLYDLRVDPNERVNLAYHEDYRGLSEFLRDKLGNIVLGDNRLECDWTKENEYMVSDFAVGAHDGRLNIPDGLVPEPKSVGLN